MIAPVGALIAAATLAASPAQLDPGRLPPLPAEGLAKQLHAGIELQTMQGRWLGVLNGLSLAPDKDTGAGLILRDRAGRLFVLDRAQRRFRRVTPRTPPVRGCRITDRRALLELLVCGHTVKTALYAPGGGKPAIRVAARAPGQVGHWERAELAPRGDAFLAQWSAECEVPVAFLVTGGAMRPYGGTTLRDAPESVALGWLANGSAVIHFPNGACGRAFRVPGVYTVPRTGRPRLLLRTPSRSTRYWMWSR